MSEKVSPLVSNLLDDPNRAKVIQAAHQFYVSGMESLDQIVHGEQDAKMMLLTEALMGARENVAVLYGPPGSGKSDLMNYFTMILPLEEDEIARISSRQDLSEAQVLGKTTKLIKSTQGEDGAIVTETLQTEVAKADINERTRALIMDEVNRANPVILNALLKILQDGRLIVYDGERAIQIEPLELVIFGMNNFGVRFTHDLDPAVISRLALGSMMGLHPPHQLSEASEAIIEEKVSGKNIRDVDSLRSIISKKNLHYLRANIDNQPFIESPGSGVKLLKQGIVLVGDVLLGHGLRIADPRTTIQLIRTSRAISMLTNNAYVTEEAIRTAIKFNLVAKLGALAVRDVMVGSNDERQDGQAQRLDEINQLIASL